MKTIIFKLKENKGNVCQLKEFQKDWSISFRKLYNNINLIDDKEYLKTLRIKSSKLKEYLKKEVTAFHERKEKSREKILNNIEKLNSYDCLTSKESKHLKNLKKSYNSNVVFGGRNNLINRSRGKISNKEWRDKRLYPMVFYGEKSNKGNRFFDFKDISSGNILFKMESTGVKLNLKIANKKHLKELILLENLSLNKEIPITVKLTYDKIYISFDESILYNSNLDIKKLNKECPYDKGSIERKAWYKLKYKEHEEYLKEGKLERYLSIDLNPNKIGYVITDDKMDLIDSGCFEIELLNSNKYRNKRKYNYALIIKELFKLIKHYKVSYFVIEKLENIIEDDYGNRNSNRKIRHEWMLNYIRDLVNRRCNESKTILIEVEAYYSSFIGNLTYDMYDPISSALELCRRGIGKFKKGFKVIPKYNPDNIITDRIDGNVDLSEFKSFVDLFKSIRDKSYRRNSKIFSKYLLGKYTNISLYKC